MAQRSLPDFGISVHLLKLLAVLSLVIITLLLHFPVGPKILHLFTLVILNWNNSPALPHGTQTKIYIFLL